MVLCHSNLAFAFGLYGAWLVSATNSDFEGGYRMGRLAITLMNRLEAKEVWPMTHVLVSMSYSEETPHNLSFKITTSFVKQFIPRVYTSVYAFINIWVSPDCAVHRR